MSEPIENMNEAIVILEVLRDHYEWMFQSIANKESRTKKHMDRVIMYLKLNNIANTFDIGTIY